MGLRILICFLPAMVSGLAAVWFAGRGSRLALLEEGSEQELARGNASAVLAVTAAIVCAICLLLGVVLLVAHGMASANGPDGGLD